MTGSRRDVCGEIKNTNERIYVALAQKVIMCQNSMQGISRGRSGLCICLHIYECGQLRVEASVQLCSCHFHVISFPFNATARRPLMVLFQNVTLKLIEYGRTYCS